MFKLDQTIKSIESIAEKAESLPLPLYSSKVQAGFPSPAEDYVEGKLDLNSYLVKHKAATFFVRAAGDSMIGAGIFPEDLLIVDRSLEAKSGHIIIAALNGELTVKRLKMKQGRAHLCPENPNYPPITVSEDNEFSVWGVVTHVVHSLA